MTSGGAKVNKQLFFARPRLMLEFPPDVTVFAGCLVGGGTSVNGAYVSLLTVLSDPEFI